MPKSPVNTQLHRHHRSLSLKKSWTLWGWWVAAVIVAELISSGIILLADTIIKSSGTESAVAVFHIVGLLEGIVLGVAQWLVLHRYVKHINAWIVVTAIAAMIAWLVGLQISSLMVFSTTLNTTLTAEMKAEALQKGVFLLGAWVGAVLGFAQWFVLKSHIRRAFFWIAANALAWALGLVIAFQIVGVMRLHAFSSETALAGTISGLTTGAIVGAITGVALIWLLKPRLQV